MSDELRTEKLSDKIVRRTGFHHVQTIAHWCPACNEMHDFAVTKPFYNGSSWQWNNDIDKPTMKPSMKIEYRHQDDVTTCHYYLIDGKIQYLDDCTHKDKGKTIDLPDIPKHVWMMAGIV